MLYMFFFWWAELEKTEKDRNMVGSLKLQQKLQYHKFYEQTVVFFHLVVKEQ